MSVKKDSPLQRCCCCLTLLRPPRHQMSENKHRFIDTTFLDQSLWRLEQAASVPAPAPAPASAKRDWTRLSFLSRSIVPIERAHHPCLLDLLRWYPAVQLLGWILQTYYPAWQLAISSLSLRFRCSIQERSRETCKCWWAEYIIHC